MKLRIIPIMLIVILFASIIELPVLAASKININDESVFTKQKTNIECPLGSTVSMLRRRAVIDGKDNWDTTYSYDNIKAVAWKDTMEYSFSFPSENGYKVYSYSMDLELGLNMGDKEGKKQYFINELKNHPEGIAAYVFFLKTPKRNGHLKSNSGKSEQHVVLLTDYDEKTDTFYCFDPARNMPSGRIKLADSSLPAYIKRAGYWNDSESVQNNILAYIAQTWMITNVSGGGSYTDVQVIDHDKHTYDDRGYCTIGREEFPITLQPISSTTYQAINDNTPIRWRPYQPEPIIRRLSKGTVVTVVAWGINSKGNIWYKLDNNTWVYSENVKKADKPSAPTKLTITKVSSKTAQLSWNPAAGAISYEVEYKSPTSNGWKTDPDYKDKASTSYITTGLGTKIYQFRVRAVNSTGSSDWTIVEYNGSNETLPNMPASLTAVRTSNTTGRISWNAVSNATSYEVQYNSPNSGGWKIDPEYKSNTSTSYNVTQLGTKATYEFRVRAVNSAGTSDWAYITLPPLSEETTPPPQQETRTDQGNTNSNSGTLPSPKNFTITKESSSTALVKWDPVDGATSYEVEFWSRSWNEWRADYEYSPYLGTKTTSYLTKGLANNPFYEFRVRAKNSGGVSEWAYFTYYK